MSETAYIAAHRRAINDLGLHCAVDAAPNYHISILKPDQGQGFVDLYDFGRVILGRGDYTLHHAQTVESHLPLQFCGINILLSGRHRLDILGKRSLDVVPPQIALRKGRFGATRVHIPAGEHMQLLSLDFSTDILHTLAGEAEHPAAHFFREPPTTRIHIYPHADAKLLHRARHILALPYASSELDLIRLESAALGLLVALLAPDHPDNTRNQHLQAVDHAQHILRNHCHERLTIPHLARRVGVNECDLKRAFKAHTGMTIAAYARAERMRFALSLLADGQELQYVASQSGYDNVQYFSRLFERHFGYHPKNHKKQMDS